MVFHKIAVISEYERAGGRPSSRSREAYVPTTTTLDRFTYGLFYTVAASLLPSIELLPMHVGDPKCTCHVQNEEVSDLKCG